MLWQYNLQTPLLCGLLQPLCLLRKDCPVHTDEVDQVPGQVIMTYWIRLDRAMSPSDSDQWQ